MPESAALKAVKKTGIRWADADHNANALEQANTLQRGGPGHASCIVYPASIDELIQVIAILNATGGHAVVQGGNTGLSEAGKSDGMIINTTRMNRITGLILKDGRAIALDPPDPEAFRRRDGQLGHWADQLAEKLAMLGIEIGSEALRDAEIHIGGGTAIDDINAVLRLLMLRIPIIMESTATATAGACAGNGTGGECAGHYGTADRYATQGRAVNGAGAVIDFSNPGRPIPGEDEPGIRADGFAYGDHPLGSQGSFSVITELRMKTRFMPRRMHTALLPVKDWQTLLHVFKEAEKTFAENHGEWLESYELISAPALSNVREIMGNDYPLKERLPDAPFYAMLTVASEREENGLDERYYAFLKTIKGPGAGASDPALYPDLAEDIVYDADNTRVSLVRRRVSWCNTRVLEKRRKSNQDYCGIAPDIAIPLKQAPEFLDALQALAHEMFPDKKLAMPIFGHIMAKIAIHLHIQGEMGKKRGIFLQRVGDLVVKEYNGARWAEHGVGQEGAEEWIRLTPKEKVERHVAIKRKNDPNNVLNPRSFGMDKLLQECKSG